MATKATAGVKGHQGTKADPFQRYLEDLCKPGTENRKRDGERHLLDYVDAEARDLTPETFSKLMAAIYARVSELLSKGWVKTASPISRFGLVPFLLVEAFPLQE